MLSVPSAATFAAFTGSRAIDSIAGTSNFADRSPQPLSPAGAWSRSDFIQISCAEYASIVPSRRPRSSACHAEGASTPL